MSEAGGTSLAINPGPAAPPAGPPNWPQFADEIHCPLCEYNLRGLTESRCPECGHSFTWSELLDRRTVHPYLFEHHPERNIRSFWKTYWRDCQPRRFWNELSPVHPVRVRRLLLYWLIASSIALVFIGAPFVQHAIAMARSNSLIRAAMLPLRGGIYRYRFPNGGFATITAAQVNANWPVPWSKPFFEQVWNQFQAPLAAQMTLIILVWPWLTILALLVFRISMRRARISTVHVFRCAFYSCDFALLLLIVTSWNWLGFHTAWLAILLCPLVTLYRLTIAYQRYMRLDHPFFTALASQTMVSLAMLDFALNV